MDIFISLRFGEALRQAQMLKAALEEAGLSCFLCSVTEGDSIVSAVAENLVDAKLVVVLGTATYGQKTASSYSTYQEMAYFMEEKKPFFLIKMCDQFEEKMTRFFFNTTVSYYSWMEKDQEAVPKALVARIKEKLNSVTSPVVAETSVKKIGQRVDSPFRIAPGNYLISGNGYMAILQPDGNFVKYSPGNVTEWNIRTNNTVSVAVQDDGNLVAYAPGDVANWHSETYGRGPVYLIMQDDGNLVLYRKSDNKAMWSTLTGKLSA